MPGLKDLAGVDRNALVRHSVRVLNGLAADRHTRFADDQEVFVTALSAGV